MNKLVREVSDLANEILECQWNVSHFEALQLATQIQYNEMYGIANVVEHNAPTALEKIAMELQRFNDENTHGY
jgi:hypothetical protein